MIQPVVLIGAGGLAREVVEAARAQRRHRMIGVLDDDPQRHGGQVLGVPVLGGLDTLFDLPGVRVLICTGDGSSRRRLADRLDVPDERYATVVHPSVDVPASCAIGAGSVVLAGCVLTAAVTVGRHCVLMPRVTCCHDDRLEDFATLCAGVSLGGGVHVGSAAYVGLNAAVRQHVALGADAVIGMGATVLTDVPAGETWVGVPARAAARSAVPTTAGGGRR